MPRLSEKDIRHVQFMISRSPKWERNFEIMRRLLEGLNCDTVAKQYELSEQTVRGVIDKVMGMVFWNLKHHEVTHPFCQTKYQNAHVYHGLTHTELVPRWLTMDDLRNEKEFLQQRFDTMTTLFKEYLRIRR